MIEQVVLSEINRFKESYVASKRELPEVLNISKYIDHTILKADATPEMISKVCSEAREYMFWSVCVNSNYLTLVNSLLKNTDVKKTVVVGFPLGQMATDAKAAEAAWAIANGADELDMVINVGLLKAREYQLVFDDVSKVVKSAEGRVVKVIVETCLLSTEEKVAACTISREAGANFVKTSTGFSTGGATVEDVSLMKFVVGDFCKVKASGGVKTRSDAIKMIIFGADRIGTSSGINIITGEEEIKGGY